MLSNKENNTNTNSNKLKTGVAIYLNPKVKDAVTTYITINDRIMSTTILTKCGPLAIINHHAPDETRPLTVKQAH